MFKKYFEKFDFIGLHGFVYALVKNYGMHQILFNPEHKELFSQNQLTHVAPFRDINNHNGFIWAWRKKEDFVRRISFNQFNGDRTKEIIITIDLDEKSISLDKERGISSIQIEEVLNNNLGNVLIKLNSKTGLVEEKEIVKLEPNFYGIGINLKSLWSKINNYWKESNKNASEEQKGVVSKKQPNLQIIFLLAVLIISIVGISWWLGIFDFFPKMTLSSLENAADLQNNESLRSLESLETGKKISQLPNNVYFFDLANAVVYEAEDAINDFIDAKKYRMFDDCFEIQKVDNRYYIIGFIGDSAYIKQSFTILPLSFEIINLPNPTDFVVFPYPWGGSKKAIGIPFDSISNISYRKLDIDKNFSISVLDIRTKEIVENIIPHELPSSKN